MSYVAFEVSQGRKKSNTVGRLDNRDLLWQHLSVYFKVLPFCIPSEGAFQIMFHGYN